MSAALLAAVADLLIAADAQKQPPELQDLFNAVCDEIADADPADRDTALARLADGIAPFDEYRVVILSKPPYSRGWQSGPAFDALVPELVVEETLPRPAVEDWFARLAGSIGGAG
ncbi:MAG: hypothetical protein ACRC7O_08295 [Fimbriiglobus sp.]